MKTVSKKGWVLCSSVCLSLMVGLSCLAQEQNVNSGDAGTEVTREEIALQAGKGARSYFQKSAAPQVSDLGLGQELPCLAYFFTLNGVVRQLKMVSFSAVDGDLSQLKIDGLRGISRLDRRSDSLVGDGPEIEGCADCTVHQYSVYVRVARDKRIVMEILQPAGLTLLVLTPTTEIISSPVTRATDYEKVAGYVVCAAPEITDAGL